MGHSRGPTVICIPTGIRPLFLTTSLLLKLGGDVVEVERWSYRAEMPLACKL